MTDNPPYLVKQGELQEEAAKWLYYNLPEQGWESCYMEYRQAGPIAEAVVRCTMTDGNVEPISPPSKLIDALMNLRDQMATLGKGAWLSMTLDIDKAGKYHYTFNYDERPKWLGDVLDEVYVKDLQKYPRPAEAIPDWYPVSNG